MRAVAILFLLLTAGLLAAAPPQIVNLTEGSGNGETAVVCGEGFAPAATEVRVWTPPGDEKAVLAAAERLPEVATPPAAPPPQAQKAEVLRVTAQTLAFVLPGGRSGPPGGTPCFVLWVRNAEGWSAPCVFNRPVPWWASADPAAPGQTLRVFGRNFADDVRGKPTYAFLRALPQGKPVRLTWGVRLSTVHEWRAPRYEAVLKLPADLAPGKYQLFLHNATGGEFGWSRPLEINVALPPPPLTAVANARDLGAAGDGIKDDTDALQDAINQLKDTGGTVLLPMGRYRVTRPLFLWDKVSVAGSGMETTVILVGDEGPFGTAFSDKYAAEKRLHEMTAAWQKTLQNQPPLFYVPGNRHTVADLTLRVNGRVGPILFIDRRDGQPTEDVTVRRCHFYRHEHAVDWEKQGTYEAAVTLTGTADRVSVTDCWFDGASGAIWMWSHAPRRRHIVIARNRFEPLPLFTDAGPGGGVMSESIIEENVTRYGWRGLVTGGGITHSFISRNVVEQTSRGENAGEVYLLESGGGPLLEVAEPGPWGVRPAKFKELGLRDHDLRDSYLPHLLVVSGRGRGQLRRVVDNVEDRLTVDRPWDIVPEAGGQVALLMTGCVRNLLIDNTDMNGDADLQMTGVENVIDGHKSVHGSGLTLYCSSYVEKGVTQYWPCWLNQLIHSRCLDRGNIVFSAGRHSFADTKSIPIPSFGNVLRDCQIMDVKLQPDNQYWSLWQYAWDEQNRNYPVVPAFRFVERENFTKNPPRPEGMTPSFDFSVVEANHIRRARVGVLIEPCAQNTLVRLNRIEEVPEAFYDQGVGSVIQPWTAPFPTAWPPQ